MNRGTVWIRNTYWKMREKLIRDMGGKCVLCGSKEKLEVDHKDGRTWDIKKLNRVMRVKRYRAEFEAGLVRLLCKNCNQFRWRE